MQKSEVMNAFINGGSFVAESKSTGARRIYNLHRSDNLLDVYDEYNKIVGIISFDDNLLKVRSYIYVQSDEIKIILWIIDNLNLHEDTGSFANFYKA